MAKKIPRLSVAATALFLAGLLGACGGNSEGHSAAVRSAGTTSYIHSAGRGTLQAVSGPVTVAELAHGIKELFRTNPGIATFEVQDVEYSATSMATVLNNCTAESVSTSSQVQSGRLLACAPLIFFLYSFGQRKSAGNASELADEIYSYAITDISGPLDSSSVLAGVLQGWGVRIGPVAATPGPPKMSPAEMALVAAAEKSILAKGSVHIFVTGYASAGQAPAETIVADIGLTSANETLTDGNSKASIRLTPNSAYFRGNPSGLINLIGVSPKVASRAGRRWVGMKEGTTEYQDFHTEDTIAALPASILPIAGNAVSLVKKRDGGQATDVLAWRDTSSGARRKVITERLVLTTGSQPLPLSEVTAIAGDTQTVTFSHWGQKIDVPVPNSSTVVPYSSIAKG